MNQMFNPQMFQPADQLSMDGILQQLTQQQQQRVSPLQKMLLDMNQPKQEAAQSNPLAGLADIAKIAMLFI